MKVSLDTVLVVDVEATCWQGPPPKGQESEIIEIGIVRVNPSKKKITGSESILIKPVKSEVSEFCTKLTGHTQEALDKKGITHYEACAQITANYLARRKIWMSWGEYDRQAFWKNPETYPFSDSHINLKNMFALIYGLHKTCGLHGALELLNMDFEGRQHSGVDDAINTAQVLIRILKENGPRVN